MPPSITKIVEPVVLDANIEFAVTIGPVDPVTPVTPVAPVIPVTPVGPVAPVSPVGPVGPNGSQQDDLIRAHI